MTPASITISKPAQPLKPIVPSILMAKPSRMSRWMSPPLRIRTIRASKRITAVKAAPHVLISAMAVFSVKANKEGSCRYSAHCARQRRAIKIAKWCAATAASTLFAKAIHALKPFRAERKNANASQGRSHNGPFPCKISLNASSSVTR